MGSKPADRPTVQRRAAEILISLVEADPSVEDLKLAEKAALVAPKLALEMGWPTVDDAALRRTRTYLARRHDVAVAARPTTLSAPEPPPDVNELWDEQRVLNERNISRAATRGKATLQIHETGWFGIGFGGDQHLDSDTADLRILEDYASVIRETPGLYNAEGGDLRDNFIIRALMRAQMDSGRPPVEQVAFIEKYLSLFEDKTLWIVAGNHDQWEDKLSGLDTLRRIANEQGILYDSDQFFIRLKCDGVEYKILTRHKFPMNSRFNPTHAHKQMIRLAVADETPDVAVLHHLHEGSVESWQYAGEERILVRPGSAKRHDPFAHHLGFPDTGYLAPVVLFNAQQRQMVPLCDYRLAPDVLRALQEAA